MTHDKPIVPVGPGQIIGPDQFGPSLWQGLHYITLGYPKKPTLEQKQKYKTFFLLLQDTIPCSICANHYSETLKKMPLSDNVLETRETLVKWLIDFHNIVNEMKNKPIIEYSKARKMIDTDKPCQINTKCNCSQSNITYLLLILLALVIIAVIYKKK